MQEYYRKYNDSVAEVNYKLFGFQSFDLPRITVESSIEENWEKLNLNDQDYSKYDYDDSNWNNWKPKSL